MIIGITAVCKVCLKTSYCSLYFYVKTLLLETIEFMILCTDWKYIIYCSYAPVKSFMDLKTIIFYLKQ